MVTIKTGDYEVMESGSVQILSTAETHITFEGISLIFSFETNEKDSPNIELRADKDNEIRFVFININRQSFGTTDFAKIGSISGGKDVYISFRANFLDDKRVVSLEYSIFKK